MNCPTCQDLISFTDIYCNSCGEILNLLAVQQSDATNPTTIDYLSYPSDQETTIPKGSYSLRFTDTDYCDLFNENDEIICS